MKKNKLTTQPVPVHRFKEHMEQVRLAKRHEKHLRRAFKGIYPWITRKILLNSGKSMERNKNGR